MATLILRLAAPLQAWGINSKFEVRRTEKQVSKSGVIGLLAAALGLKRDGDLSNLNSLRFGVRIDKEGVLLRDYHTAHSKKDSFITNRYYLSDAIFVVGLESENIEFLKELSYALNHPVFPLFLGRRSCPPTQPLLLGIRDENLENALKNEPWQVKSDKMPQSLRIVLECDASDKNAVFVKDAPLSFNPEYRRYGIRSEKEDYISFEISKTNHDAMALL